MVYLYRGCSTRRIMTHDIVITHESNNFLWPPVFVLPRLADLWQSADWFDVVKVSTRRI